MGVRIEPYVSDFSGDEWVVVTEDDSIKGPLNYKHFKASHADFRAACCRDLGLVDPNDAPYPISQDDVDELCRKRMAEKTRCAADHAADVLAAASRRLA